MRGSGKTRVSVPLTRLASTMRATLSRKGRGKVGASVVHTIPRSRDTLRPSFANGLRPKRRGRTRPLKKRRGEDRVRAAPAISCAKHAQKNAHEHTGEAEAVRPSLRNGVTAYFVLSLVTGFVVTIVAWILPRGLNASIGASGPHDFAVRIRALRLCAQPASIAPRTNVRDDRDTPLLRARDNRR